MGTVGWWVDKLSFKIGDNRAYVDSDGKEPEKEKDSEGSEYSLPQGPLHGGGYRGERTGRHTRLP